MLALLVVPTIIVEQTTSGEPWETIAVIANWIIWLGFALELAYVLRVAERKRAALRAHWLDVGIVVVTVPLFLNLLASLRLLRLTRLSRLLRVVRLAIVGARALQAARAVFSPQGFRYVGIATGLLVVIAGFTVAIADAESFANPWIGMWWAVTTVTTVGYGDVVPQTVAGRIIASMLMLVGIGFLSLFTATIASSFLSSGEEAAKDERHEMLLALERLEARFDERLTAIEAKLPDA